MKKLTRLPTTPIVHPCPVEVEDVTEQEAQSPKFIFARMRVRMAIEAQAKELRRSKKK